MIWLQTTFNFQTNYMRVEANPVVSSRSCLVLANKLNYSYIIDSLSCILALIFLLILVLLQVVGCAVLQVSITASVQLYNYRLFDFLFVRASSKVKVLLHFPLAKVVGCY